MNFISLIRLLWDHRRSLITVTSIAAVLSIVVSLLIEEKYRSGVLMYPAETSSISQSVLNTEGGAKEDITRFGKEEEAKQLIQLLESEQIFGRIRRKYDLGEHYDIDPEHPHLSSAIKNKYESMVDFSRTKYGSVRISVLDHDRDTAAMIANDIAAYLDTVKNRMQRNRAREALDVVEREFRDLRGYIGSLEDSLQYIRSKGIHDYETQAEMFNEQLAIAIRKGNSRAVNDLRGWMDTLSRYGGPYVSLNLELEEIMLQYGRLRNRYQQAQADANKNISHKFIVDRAYPADRKAYPIRWLIVVSSTLGTFLMAVFFIIGRIKWKEALAEEDEGSRR